MTPLKIIALFFISLFLFTGCSVKVEQKKEISKANFQKADMALISGFKEDNLDKALSVFIKDCAASKKDPRLAPVCLEASKNKNLKNPSKFFTENFTAYQLISDEGDDEGLITGYYEPLLHGSLYRTNKYKYPVYGVPKDLLTISLSSAYPALSNYRLRGKIQGKKVVPYETRAQIDKIDYKKSETLKPICFVDDKIDLFFLQIQGSGKVQLQNGRIINVGYGAQNGRPYYSIGRKLIQMEAIKREDVSLQSIKKWLIENPKQRDEILNLNQSYVFFNRNKKTATGSLGTELTANRNLAVDRKNIPLGFPVFINTTNPVTEKPINQLMVAADTGGAIKGKIRADLFFGNGNKARELAGKMKQKGKLFIFIPNSTQKKKD